MELTFIYQGKIIKRFRNPEYLRPKGGGTDLPLQKERGRADASTCRQPVTKTREVA